MFALRAHQAYPNSTWLDMVETISNNNTLYWTDTCGGGVLWLTYKPMIKNTITNGCVPRKPCPDWGQLLTEYEVRADCTSAY